MEHVLLGVDLFAREVAGVAPGRRAARAFVAAAKERREKTAAHRGPPSGSLIPGIALFPRVNLHAPREPVRLEAHTGFVFPPQSGVARAPPTKLGQRLRRRRHQRLEKKHDVTHHRHLRVVIPELPALAGEVERQFVGVHGETHLQAHLRQQLGIPGSEIGRFLPPEDDVVVGDGFLDAVEVVQHLGQPPGPLRAVKAEVLSLHAERPHLEPERSYRSVRVAAVVQAERRRVVGDPQAQHRVGNRREGRER